MILGSGRWTGLLGECTRSRSLQASPPASQSTRDRKTAGARPLGGNGNATTKPLLTDAEASALMLGGALTPEVAKRFCARPDPACADAVLASVLSAETGFKVQITSVFRALLAFAKNQWGPKLRTALEKFSPDIKVRQAELILLGASKDPAAQGILLEALQKDPTKDSALGGADL